MDWVLCLWQPCWIQYCRSKLKIPSRPHPLLLWHVTVRAHLTVGQRWVGVVSSLTFLSSQLFLLVPLRTNTNCSQIQSTVWIRFSVGLSVGLSRESRKYDCIKRKKDWKKKEFKFTPQVTVWRNFRETLCWVLHAGPCCNNGLIKRRLFVLSSAQVLGSQLDVGMSEEGGFSLC